MVTAGQACVIHIAAAGRLRAPSSSLAKTKGTPKLVLNAYGCIDIGKPCRGKDAICCSAICQGREGSRLAAVAR